MIKFLAPTVLSATVILGIVNMKNVVNDIKTQCNYGMRYFPKS
jgi:hypothetical protein